MIIWSAVAIGVLEIAVAALLWQAKDRTDNFAMEKWIIIGMAFLGMLGAYHLSVGFGLIATL